jgi:membrane protein implicated in regulation of membrane protease activity
MQNYIVWIAAGFALVLAELASGTFYLLVLGIAAFAGGAAAWFGAGFGAQAVIAAAVALIGVWWVHQRRKSIGGKPMPGLDLGQPVAFDSWVNQTEGMARVKYRGTLWDAHMHMPAGESPAPGDIYYINAADGSTLHVAKTKS